MLLFDCGRSVAANGDMTLGGGAAVPLGGGGGAGLPLRIPNGGWTGGGMPCPGRPGWPNCEGCAGTDGVAFLDVGALTKPSGMSFQFVIFLF